jgi:hypothetical protein
MTAKKKATKRGKKIANLKTRRGKSKSVTGGNLLEAATKGKVFKKVAIHVTA